MRKEGKKSKNKRSQSQKLNDKSEEIMKFRRHQYEENPGMRVSGEDVQLEMDCNYCGPGVTEYLLTKCDDCGKSWVREDYTMSVIGNDVVCLFPSLDSANTGRIVHEEVENSTMVIDGFNVKLGLKYIAINEEYTGELEPLRKLLQRRVTKHGVKTTIGVW